MPRKTATAIIVPVLSILAAMIASSTLVALTGNNPLMVFRKMILSTLGSGYGLGQIIFRATTLLLTGLAVALPFKVRLFNIGAEGQLLMGSFAAALAGIAIPATLPMPAAASLALFAAMCAGCFWALLAGWMKIRFGVNEVISTIMLNFIAQACTGYVLTYHLAVPSTVHTPLIAESSRLPRLDHLLGLFGKSPANVSTFIAVCTSVAVTILLYRTRFGYEMRAVGLKPEAAAYAGIKTDLHVLSAICLAGAIAGLGAGNLVLGYKHYYETGLTSGAGFMGIAVALLADAHPLWLLLSALLFGWLDYGGLTVNTSVPKDLFMMVQAMTILCIISLTALLRRNQNR
jgi:simple sugar transport system permease protein